MTEEIDLEEIQTAVQKWKRGSERMIEKSGL